MDSVNIRMLLIVVLVAAVLILTAVILIMRRRRGSSRRSDYIEALYALIEGRKDDAFNLLSRAVRGGEDDVDAYIQLGNLMRERGQADKALQLHRGLTVRQGLSFEDDKSIQLAIAEDLSALGRMERAIKALEVVRRKGKDPEVLEALHRFYHIRNDFDQAYGVLKDLSRVDLSVTRKKRASYLTSVAYRLIESGQKDAARKYLDRARKEDASCSGALYLSASLAMERGDLGTAVRRWEELLNNDMEYFPEVASRLEKALFESGRFDELEGILSRLLEKNPEDDLLLSSLARFYSKKGEISRGIDLLEGARNRIGSNKNLSGGLALLYLKNGRVDDSLTVLEENDRASTVSGGWTCENCGREYDTNLGFCGLCCSFNTIRRNESL